MTTATVRVDRDFRIGAIDRRLFGFFVEHMGRGVYGGVYDPGHPSTVADTNFRGDVLELTRELGATTMRYPGGNFVSSHRWEDGVGPLKDRPRTLDLAWRTVESNAFGLHEFMDWTDRAGVDPYMVVNLGTRGPGEAAALVEYCNVAKGTTLAELRQKNGVDAPFGVQLWGLGNEMDGSWQVGHRSARSYGEVAGQAAQAMKLVDSSIETVLCGSSNMTMPTYASWEAEALDAAYEHIDYVSLHQYYDPEKYDEQSFLASACSMDRHIEDAIAAVDFVRARQHRQRRIHLAYDEWNVWYQSRFREPYEWSSMSESPRVLIEDDFTVRDAVVAGSLLMTLLRHADRVRIACQAQLVNVIAPIRTFGSGSAWKQPIFYPFALTARHARGDVLRSELSAPTIDTERFGPVPAVDVVATHDETDGKVAIFAVNRSRQPITLQGATTGFGELTVTGHHVLADEDTSAVNTPENPLRVRPRDLPVTSAGTGNCRQTLPPVSWNLITLAPAAP
ncbi:Intracellular exo-alpha-(1-_5)-L-arabinofuranosidase [Streptomyces sp. MP131-18]|nr:Intracellular exo-alpha-(1->5)-L-arabinofuranosidase [Streptomyces sp. MP131-18]